MSAKKLSILVPMHNEEEAIPVFFPALNKVLAVVDMDYQVICVDDGSTDGTLALLSQMAEVDGHIRIVVLSRNFGKEVALTAALDYAEGDAIIPIDADLQDPPEVIPALIEKWQEGNDVVYARRKSRESDSSLKRKTAEWFYSVIDKLSDIEIPRDVGDFRLMDRKVVDAVKSLPERERFMKGLFCWPGFKSAVVEFDRPIRMEGTTKFSYWKLWNFALSGITSFSTLPIRLGTYLGVLVSGFSLIFGIYIIVKTLILGVQVPGYASLLVVMLFIGGIQLFFMGVMGEYIGRIYTEVKNRPLYFVAKEIGFKKKD
jgi:glycosyltransferase involved in cell wall biosynthesis